MSGIRTFTTALIGAGALIASTSIASAIDPVKLR